MKKMKIKKQNEKMKIKNNKMDFMKSRICYKKKEHKMMDFMENKTKKMNFVIKKKCLVLK